MKKTREICKTVFGYGIMLSLFAGGLTFFAYMLALIIGGDAAVWICDITYNHFIPVVVKACSCMILLGLVCMYLTGEKSLTPSEKKQKMTSKK